MRLLILPGFDAPLPISVKFLTIGAKTILAEGFPDFSHELEVIRQIVDGIELGAQDLISLLEVI